MLNLEATQLLRPYERYVFEQAAMTNNLLMQTSLLVDGQIASAQQRARDTPGDQIPNFHDEIIDLTAQARYAIDRADQSGQGSWTDYYRLISQTAFLEQRLKAPFVFEKSQHWKERAELVNGIYGVSTRILHSAINEYDTHSIRQSDEEELRGVIQEQTFLALFNREQHRKRIAIPTTTVADLHYKVDVDVWTMHDKQTEPFYLPVQIKSSEWYFNKRSTPEGGITIFGYEYDNDRSLKISRLIASEYKYMTGKGDALTPPQEQCLQDASAMLFAAMEYKSHHAI